MDEFINPWDTIRYKTGTIYRSTIQEKNAEEAGLVRIHEYRIEGCEDIRSDVLNMKSVNDVMDLTT